MVSLQKARSDLLKIVGSEYTPIVIAGKEIDPSQAAREVSSGYGVNDWIPGPIHDSSPIPLNDLEVVQLYEINRQISSLDDVELGDELPQLDGLPSEELFCEWIDEFVELKKSDLNYRRDLWFIPNNEVTTLDDLYSEVSDQVSFIEKMEGAPWKLAVIQAGMELGATADVWKLLCDNIATVRKQAQDAAKAIFEHGPKLSDLTPLEDQFQILVKIEQNFRTKGGISWCPTSACVRQIGVLD